jgi:hypothetical protein
MADGVTVAWALDQALAGIASKGNFLYCLDKWVRLRSPIHEQIYSYSLSALSLGALILWRLFLLLFG